MEYDSRFFSYWLKLSLTFSVKVPIVGAQKYTVSKLSTLISMQNRGDAIILATTVYYLSRQINSLCVCLFSETSERTTERAAVSDAAASGSCVPRRSCPASCQVSEGHQDVTVLARRVHAGTVQHRPPACACHVHLRHIRHVVLHAREKDERNR